jgi:hypothetical protein
MKNARPVAGLLALGAFVAAAVLYAHVPVRGFDLRGSPVLVKRPGADITDTYFFPSPTNPSNVVAVMDVYPLIPPGAGTTTFFDQSVLYTMKFDNRYASEAITPGSRPVENLVLQFSFGPPTSGTQQVFVYGFGAPVSVGGSTKLINSGAPTGVGFINKSFAAGNGVSSFNVFAGGRRDPDFFNASQFYNIFPDRNQGSTTPSCLPGGSGTCPQGFNSAPGTDLFANSNVLSIVAEFPRNLVAGTGNGVVAYWATTSTTTGQ